MFCPSSPVSLWRKYNQSLYTSFRPSSPPQPSSPNIHFLKPTSLTKSATSPNNTLPSSSVPLYSLITSPSLQSPLPTQPSQFLCVNTHPSPPVHHSAFPIPYHPLTPVKAAGLLSDHPTPNRSPVPRRSPALYVQFIIPIPIPSFTVLHPSDRTFPLISHSKNADTAYGMC